MKGIAIPALGILLYLCCACTTNKLIQAEIASSPKSFCNPINIDYRFMVNCPGSREAADPVFVFYKGDYYLFASKSSGYWWSPDFSTWNFVPISPETLPIESYAPAIIEHKEALYFVSSAWGQGNIYQSTNPKAGQWEVAGQIERGWDPGLFIDRDSLYLYYGSSNIDPVSAFAMSLNDFSLNGKGRPIVKGQPAIHGWERTGEYNNETSAPYIEGAWMTKYKDKYYLQYSGPGTQWSSYADGVYVSEESPTQGFTYQQHNPITYKPTGFARGAGHGCMFTDKQGDFWRAGTVSISVNHWFERRIALFPTGFDQDDVLYSNTAFGDYPMPLPGSKNKIEWMLLSYKKPVEVSSALDSLPATNAVDEDLRSYWAAQTNNAGEWFKIDLQERALVNAIQINFAEHGSKLSGRQEGIIQQYRLYASVDGIVWTIIADKSRKQSDTPHDYIEFSTGFKARYLKIENCGFTCGDSFSLRGFRVFGKGSQPHPSKVDQLEAARDANDDCRMTVSWKKDPRAEGYVVRYGIAPNKLYNQYEVRDAEQVIVTSLNAGTDYFVRIDPFNNSGIIQSDHIICCKSLQR